MLQYYNLFKAIYVESRPSWCAVFVTMTLLIGDRDSINVLLVDDDAQFVELVKVFLEREDRALSVTTAVSPLEGLALLEENGFDCVISDFQMPEMNGLEFLREVRRIHGVLPFIMFTSQSSEEIISEAISAGATEYLQKERITEQCATLTDFIRNAVRQHRSEGRIGR